MEDQSPRKPFAEGKFDPTVILFLIASPHCCSFCAVSTYLNYTDSESVLAYTEGKGTVKSGGCAHRTYITFISCFSTIFCLVPPVCTRKAHSFSVLNGGSINEIVKRKIVRWVLRVQYKYAAVGSIYLFVLLMWIHFKLL